MLRPLFLMTSAHLVPAPGLGHEPLVDPAGRHGGHYATTNHIDDPTHYRGRDAVASARSAAISRHLTLDRKRLVI